MYSAIIDKFFFIHVREIYSKAQYNMRMLYHKTRLYSSHALGENKKEAIYGRAPLLYYGTWDFGVAMDVVYNELPIHTWLFDRILILCHFMPLYILRLHVRVMCNLGFICRYTLHSIT